MQRDGGLPELRWSTLQQFFAAVKESPSFASLPVIKTELQHHARGCYSAYGEGKYLNRRAERSLGESETISLMANLSAGHAYSGVEYAESWWKVLFCQFHDLLAGTALYADYQDLRDSVGYACEVAQTSKIEALEAMAKRVDLSGVKESAVFLFNPLPWRRMALVEFHTEKDPENHGLITHLQAKDGTAVPIQFRPPDSMTIGMPRLSAWADLPACGYKVFELAHGQAPEGKAYSNSFSVSETGFGISSLKAEDGTELLAGPVGLVVLSDTSDTWSHDVKQFRQEMGRPVLVSAGVVEDGPVTRVTRHRATWMNSEIILDIAQFAGIDAVELRFVIDWREHQQMLKLEVPTAVQQPRLFAKVPGEIIERKTNGEEEPYQDWAAVQGRIGNADYTIGILNNSTYSYDCWNGLFRTVLIRSAPFARHQPSPTTYFDTNAWQDQGRQERRFWLIARKGGYSQMSLDRRAEELQTPAEYVVDSAHEGQESWEGSFLEIQPSSVWILATKRAEGDSDGTILRLQERSGISTNASLKSSILGLDHSVPLKPWELKTVLIRKSADGKAELREVSLLEI
jgi:alpha-mannosidase